MPLRSLRAMVIAFIAMLSLATLLTAAAVYFALMGAIDVQVDKRLEREAAELLEGNPPVAQLVERIAGEMRRRDSADIGFLLRAPDGKHLAGNIVLPAPVPPGISTIGKEQGIAGLTRGQALLTRLPGGAALTLVAESEPIEHHDAQRLRILAAGFGTILLLLIAGTWALSRAITARIDRLRTTAESIVDGDMQARVPIDGLGGPFERQAEAFNHMLDRIDALMVSLTGISNDIAHDLRTPLARLHGRIQALAVRPEAEAVRGEIEALAAQNGEILQMFAAILRITEVEGGDRRALFARIDLGDLIEEAGAALDPVIEESGHVLTIAPGEPLAVEGDARLLAQALVNLIENAVNHTPPGTRITLGVRRHGDLARLTVRDDGPGIPEEARTHALRRFGRLEASRNRPGHGLGLPLVQAIARLHHGTLELADAAPGLAVHLDLPLVP
ncbi:ATP-binding protein [Sphingomonas sp. KR3-1]|uniref:HAMP domain-containing sensor histidine kinase n=1 Tax=Sphingomonas sp. KR3-1 TaxID=3156611 RepID=UPI0032B538CD